MILQGCQSYVSSGTQVPIREHFWHPLTPTRTMSPSWCLTSHSSSSAPSSTLCLWAGPPCIVLENSGLPLPGLSSLCGFLPVTREGITKYRERMIISRASTHYWVPLRHVFSNPHSAVHEDTQLQPFPFHRGGHRFRKLSKVTQLVNFRMGSPTEARLTGGLISHSPLVFLAFLILKQGLVMQPCPVWSLLYVHLGSNSQNLVPL